MLCTNVLKCYEHLISIEWYVFVSEFGVIMLCSNFGELHKFTSRESFERYIKEHKIKYVTKDKLPNFKRNQNKSDVIKFVK